MLRYLQAAAAVITVTLTGCGALPQSIELEGDQPARSGMMIQTV